jgi:hypothetical protein
MYRERHARTCETNGKSVIAHRIDEQIAEIFKSLELPSAWRARITELIGNDEDAQKIQALN